MPGRGTRNYNNIDSAKIELMLDELIARGCIIAGHNPWDVATHLHGIKLRAEWNEATSHLTISIVRRNWYVSHETIWSNVDSLMLHM
ncbi:MAG TPA: hypothetical protein VMM54_03680 [Nitrospirota bacterium]|nr:hypothetical protein [Nitrospirota bacterium]